MLRKCSLTCFALAFALALLVGCVDVEVYTVLAEDGSGKRLYRTVLDASTTTLLRADPGYDLEQDVDGVPGYDRLSVSGVYEVWDVREVRGGRMTYELVLRFSDLADLDRGNIDLHYETRGEKRVMRVEERMGVSKDSTQFEQDTTYKLLLDPQVGEQMFVYRIIMPGTILDANTDNVDGRTVRWEVPLSVLVEGGYVFEAEAVIR
jgi:hypothetical protein